MLNKRGTPTWHAACRRWGSERCASGGITGASGISMDWFSRDNLQESPIFNGKIHGFRLRSPKPIHWESPAKSSSCCSWTSPQISCGSRRSFTAPGPMYEMLSHETAAGLAGTQNTFVDQVLVDFFGVPSYDWNYHVFLHMVITPSSKRGSV